MSTMLAAGSSCLCPQIELLISRLLEYQHTKESANLSLAFRSTTLEIITSYCFGRSSNALDSRDVQNGILTAMDQTFPHYQIRALASSRIIGVHLEAQYDGYPGTEETDGSPDRRHPKRSFFVETC